ncbi:hypothetical protein RND81_01G054800 [Saponaria officinalis]
MNPNYITTTPDYSQNHQNNNINNSGFSNVSPSTLTHGLIPSPHHHHPQLIGIPLSGAHHSTDLSRPSHHHHNHHNNQMAGSIIQGLVGSSRGPHYHHLWSPGSDGSPGSQPGPIQDFSGQAGRGGLSLSLSPGHQRAGAGVGGEEDGRMSVTVASGPGTIIGSRYLKAAQELLEEVVNVGDNGESSGVHKHDKKAKAVVKGGSGGGGDDDMAGGDDGGNGGDEGSKKVVELSMAQRHELQMKKAKLLNMLDEVEQRYRQYNTQMQIVASSFEQTAGIGSAKSYTSLALKTISKQFRSLKDAISSQIKAANKSLGEENNGGIKLEGGAGSRLRLVDQQIRQQRALQQLGMMQHSHNAWRPQRGLPERAVSVLRAWLFEHFLHPYPKDSDKHMLAKQTGLTRSQVSNWFINARVRLWKPMVEEMYVEEMKSHEQNGLTSDDNPNTTTTTTTNNGGNIGAPSSKNEHNQDPSATNKTTIIPQQQDEVGFNMIHQNSDHNNHHQTTNDMISSLSTLSTSPQGFTLIGSSSDMSTLMARSQKKQRNNSSSNNNNSDMNSPSSILSMDMEMKPIDHQKFGHSSSMMSTHGGAGFNPYIINNNSSNSNNNIAGRFNPSQLTTYHGNTVSLTLGLPHCGDNNISMSENHQQNFFPNNQGMDLGRRLEIGATEADFCGSSMGQTSHPSNVYESIDIQSRKRFAAQILHDFVA